MHTRDQSAMVEIIAGTFGHPSGGTLEMKLVSYNLCRANESTILQARLPIVSRANEMCKYIVHLYDDNVVPSNDDDPRLDLTHFVVQRHADTPLMTETIQRALVVPPLASPVPHTSFALGCPWAKDDMLQRVSVLSFEFEIVVDE
jgi:hypothetical protein